jgi:hypothetical protein
LTCFSVAVALLGGEIRADEAKPAPVWLDSAPLAKRKIVLPLDGDALIRVDVLGERLFRVRHSKTKQWTESALSRYSVGLIATRNTRRGTRRQTLFVALRVLRGYSQPM